MELPAARRGVPCRAARGERQARREAFAVRTDLAALKQLPASATQDWQHLEQQGWQRLARVRNLELLRNLFRRPLELWLLLDRALYLEEQGYAVRLGHFCPSQLTPRNLLLLAERH